MTGVLKMMRRPRSEHARANDDGPFPALTLCHCRAPSRQNGSAARSSEERAARYFELRCACGFAAAHALDQPRSGAGGGGGGGGGGTGQGSVASTTDPSAQVCVAGGGGAGGGGGGGGAIGAARAPNLYDAPSRNRRPYCW